MGPDESHLESVYVRDPYDFDNQFIEKFEIEAGQGGTDASAGGICVQIGCSSSDECGTGATCCTPSQGGGLVQICIPEACHPLDCVPVGAP